jgi:hypothetical protein
MADTIGKEKKIHFSTFRGSKALRTRKKLYMQTYKSRLYTVAKQHLYSVASRGVGTGGGTGGTCPPHPNFSKGLKVPFFGMKSALFVQGNVAVNHSKITSKVPFLFGNFDVFKQNLVKNVQFRYGIVWYVCKY